MYVVRNKECFVAGFGVGQRYSELLPTFVGFDQHHQFAKNLAHVAAIDFVDDEYPWVLRISLRSSAKLMKNSVFQREVAFLSWAKPLDEVFVRIRLMKLNPLNSGRIHLTD